MNAISMLSDDELAHVLGCYVDKNGLWTLSAVSKAWREAVAIAAPPGERLIFLFFLWIDDVKCESVSSRLRSVTGLYWGRLTVR